MRNRWVQAIDEIQREKYGDAEDLRREGWSGRKQSLKNGLRFLLYTGTAVLLLSLLRCYVS